MMSIGMGEYTLDSIDVILVSSCSSGKLSKHMKSSSSAMTIYGKFFQSSVPLKDEKKYQAIMNWIYREEDSINEVTLTTPISPKRYGKGFSFSKRWVTLDMEV